MVDWRKVGKRGGVSRRLERPVSEVSYALGIAPSRRWAEVEGADSYIEARPHCQEDCVQTCQRPSILCHTRPLVCPKLGPPPPILYTKTLLMHLNMYIITKYIAKGSKILLQLLQFDAISCQQMFVYIIIMFVGSIFWFVLVTWFV